VKVAVAMSGGVDSSVAAALLKEAGHDIFGVTMQLITESDAAADAREVTVRLGIPHYIIDLREDFRHRVIAPFCEEYARGHTPNPCVVCNREIKFGRLREKAAALGAEYIATGHYARVQRDETAGDYRLRKGADINKDQSYFLCRLAREQLAHAIFPVGGMTKPEVRRIAAGLGLKTASRRESQEACFIRGGDVAAFVNDFLGRPASPGPILDGDGNVLGEHRGITSYTIGQRHGLGIAVAKPLYVNAIRPERNAVIVGEKGRTFTDELVAGDLNWLVPVPERPINIKARVRHRHIEAPAVVTPLDSNTVYVKFARPQMAITPGQTVAFYDGEYVIGGGTILKKGK
jgi:tRNA-specific 2-thiouridylase